ncbi:MAG: hypothetical protein IKQ25_11965 [Lachnospiraceae bacterium]|nr:hypothetical protein [Lachnospiraceae bacterium]
MGLFSLRIIPFYVQVREYRGKEIRLKVGEDGDGDYLLDVDELTDFDEVYIWETNPRKPDTDDDGLDDCIELDNWFDPLEGDADHDGRLDLQELAEGTNPRVYNKHGLD